MGGGDLVGTRWSPATAIERLLTPVTLKHAALVLCWSRNLECIVHEISGPRARTAILLGGIDRKTFCPGPPPPGLAATLGIPPGAVVVLSPRLFWPRQNIDTIVRGFAVFREHVENAVLLLVRYRAEELPEYARTIDALVVDLGLHSHVRMLSTIPNEQMASYYRLASVTVSIPSTDGTPMSVAESLACKTPVIVSDLPDYDPELFAGERTVLRIDPRDPRALGEALQRLAADAQLRERLAETGAALVARSVDQDGEMDRLEAFYRTVIEEGHS
jgi:glycosyltransferase involved in cell wall biosynthesis